MRRWVWVCGLAFASVLLVRTTTPSAAEDTLQPPSWFTASSPLMDSVSPGDIETAIQRLDEPIDQEQLNKIFLDLARLEDATERDRLQRMLDERMQGLMKFPMPSTAQSTADRKPDPNMRAHPKAVTMPNDPSHYELLVRIDTLNLGPDATADDLRARDQLVSQIAGIRDPIMRDELLAKLEEKEREWQEVVERP